MTDFLRNNKVGVDTTMSVQDVSDNDASTSGGVPQQAEYEEPHALGKLIRSVSVPTDQKLLMDFTRERTRSAHGIRIRMAEDKDQVNVDGSGPEKVKETEFVEYSDFNELFKGTERQVLYRINMLIHQHEDLNGIKKKIKQEKNVEGYGILHHAVINKFVTVAEKLVENGATVLDVDRYGNTPLHFALGCQQEGTDEKQTSKKINTEDDEENDTKKESEYKFDEMAALLISKMKPFRVRQLFGDTTDLAKFENNEDADIKSHMSKPAPKDDTAYLVDNNDETSKWLKLDTFNFFEIVKDKDLQETARTILDKLEDRDPENNEPVVYVELLVGEKSTDVGQKSTDVGQKSTDVGQKSTESNADDNSECAFHFIAKHRTELTNHPVCRAVIKHKWDEWAFLSYVFDTILWFLSFVALTICTVVGAQSDGVFIYDSNWQYIRGSLEILMCLFILRSVYTEFLQILIDIKGYWKSVMNWIELGSAIILIIEIILRYAEVNEHWFLFAVGYVLWTIKGVKYASVTSHTSAYSETLRTIMIRDFWLFALFFIAIEMVFGGTFLLVLKGTDSLAIEPQTTTILGIYYVGLRTMIEAQMPIDYDGFPKIAIFVILVFMSLTIVVMLNILIAQLSTTYEAAYAEGRIKSWVNRADAIVNFEKEDEFREKHFCKALCHCRLIYMLCYREAVILRCFPCCKKSNKTADDNEQEKGCKTKLPFDKEKFLEEKEKMEEMRTTLKQLDGKLIHADLTIQTIKTRQNVLLHSVQGKSVGSSNTGESNVQNDSKQYQDLYKRIDEVKSKQFDIASKLDAVIRDNEEFKKLLITKIENSNQKTNQMLNVFYTNK